MRVASICRTLVSWALMLSRRWLAAASSRSESARIRATWARASPTMLAAWLLGLLDEPAVLAHRLVVHLLGVGARLVDVGLELGEPLPGVLHLGGEVLLRRGPAPGQGGLEVGGGLGGLGALLLEDRLRLLEPGGRVALGRVEPVVGPSAGVLEHARGLGLGVGPGLLGVLVGVAALARDLVGDLAALVVEQGAAAVEQVARLVLGEAEDLGDPLAEVLERRRAGLRAARVGGLAALLLEHADALGELVGVRAGLLGLLRQLLHALVDLRGLVAAQDDTELGGVGHGCVSFSLGADSAGPSVGTAESLDDAGQALELGGDLVAALGQHGGLVAGVLEHDAGLGAQLVGLRAGGGEVLGGLLTGAPELVLRRLLVADDLVGHLLAQQPRRRLGLLLAAAGALVDEADLVLGPGDHGARGLLGLVADPGGVGLGGGDQAGGHAAELLRLALGLGHLRTDAVGDAVHDGLQPASLGGLVPDALGEAGGAQPLGLLLGRGQQGLHGLLGPGGLLLGRGDGVGRLGARGAEHLLRRLVRVRPDLLGVGEHGVRVGVGVLAERLGLLDGLGADRGRVLVGGDPQLLGGADRLELLLAHGHGRDGQESLHQRGRGRDRAIGGGRRLEVQPLRLGDGDGDLVHGGGPLALGELGAPRR